MKIYLTREIPESGLNMLRKNIESISVYQETKPIPKEILHQNIEDVDGLVTLLTDEISDETLDKAKNLKVISNYAVGYDNIDVESATERGIMVTNTPGVLTQATAELTWALLLCTVRNLLPADQFVRDGNFNGWSPTLFRGLELDGKTLGILGAGRIGRAVGRIASAFGMNVLYLSRSRKPQFEEDVNAKYAELSVLLPKTDVLSIHLPLTPDTHHMITKNELVRMKEGAYLINTGRGSVVKEDDLVEALETDHLAGAGLDVYENEPDVHPKLQKRNDVVLLPHVGSATHQTRDEMARMTAQNLIDGLNNDKPENLVNPEALRD